MIESPAVRAVPRSEEERGSGIHTSDTMGQSAAAERKSRKRLQLVPAPLERRSAARSRRVAPARVEAVAGPGSPGRAPGAVAWFALDFLSAALGACLVVWMTDRMGAHLHGRAGLPLAGPAEQGVLALAAAFVTSLLVRLTGMQEPQKRSPVLAEQMTLLLAASLGVVCSAGVAALTSSVRLDCSSVLLGIGACYALLSLNRSYWRQRSNARFQSGKETRNYILAGVNPTAYEVRAYLQTLRYLGYTFKGFVTLDDGVPESAGDEPEVLGSINGVIALAKYTFADEIIFTRRPETPGVLSRTMEAARHAAIDVRLIPSVAESLQNRKDVQYVGTLPTIVLHQRRSPVVSLLVKRVIDIAGACVGLLLAVPIGCLLAIAIKLDSEGPVLYVSPRVGYKGRKFQCYKFRTMVQNAEALKPELVAHNERDGILFKMKDDPRITRVGRVLRKYSLDELPQFWNVLLGDMSLVGPRPPICSEVAQYAIEHLTRLEVVPGVTGLWQVQARAKPSFQSYIELDRRYVSTWSLWLDLKILIATFKVVFGGTGS